MKCYNCGCNLSEHDFCTACGAEVSLYKKIMKLSNLFYNEGLDKAGVRDLTGAVTSLRQSLKFNKNNVDARNLLGLVYFEMGEVVAALSEWVISKNLRPNKNVADDYIERLQSNSGMLESINQTIKKYNQALTYCRQDSKDLAVIQLKKVLSLNPKFIRAHQLLALLYIDSEEWDKAKKELVKCANIDANNRMTLRYRKEVDALLEHSEEVKISGKRKSNEAVRYQSDNEIIIQPLNVKEPKNTAISTLFNIGIGLVLGMAAIFFLVLPGTVTTQKNKANEQIQIIAEQLDAKTATIAQMEQEASELQESIDGLQAELQNYVGEDGTLHTIDNLLDAASGYIESQDAQAAAVYLESITAEVTLEYTSESFQNLYNALLGSIGPELSQTYYTTGYRAYRDELFDQAIADLSKAVYYDASNRDALFNLGNAYRKMEDTQNALDTYQQVIDLFPGTASARRSQEHMDDLNGN